MEWHWNGLAQSTCEVVASGFEGNSGCVISTYSYLLGGCWPCGAIDNW